MSVYNLIVKSIKDGNVNLFAELLHNDYVMVSNQNNKEISKDNWIKNVSEMHGLSSKTQFAIFLIMLGAFIMIGIPPTIGFFSKWYLLLGVVQSENFYILLVLILSTLLNAGYYFPIIYKSYFSRTDVQSNENMKEDLLLLFPILIIGIVTILLFFGLEPIMNFIQIYTIK